MSTTLRVIIALMVWLLYSLVAYHGCIKPTCCDVSAEAVTDQGQPFDVGQLGPVIADWSGPEVRTNAGYEAWRQNLIDQFKGKDNAFLEITGLYYEAELKPEGSANMGFARAEAIKQMLAPDIPSDHIRTRARAILDEPADIRERPFNALGDVSWIESEEKVDESVTNVLDEEGRIDRVIFLFALNATIQDENPEIMAELEKMAKNIIAEKQTVSVVGHTDNVGDSDYNVRLGRQRANTIRDVLIDLGVPAAQIRVDSKGETQPTDTNETETGRQNNRRVEVRILD